MMPENIKNLKMVDNVLSSMITVFYKPYFSKVLSLPE